MMEKSSHSPTAAASTLAISIMMAIELVNWRSKIMYHFTSFLGISLCP